MVTLVGGQGKVLGGEGRGDVWVFVINSFDLTVCN